MGWRERAKWRKRGSVWRRKLTFSYFPFVCLRKDVSGRERENSGNAWAPSSCLLQCRPGSLSSSLSAPHYFNYTCHLRSSHFTSLLGFLSPLTGTVNWACLSCWLGLDPGLRLGVGAHLGSGEWWERGRRGREWFWKGRDVMSLRQCRAIGTLHGSSLHCEASILTAAETEEERRGRRGEKMQWHKTDVVDSIFLSPPFKSFCLFHSHSLSPQSLFGFFSCFM